MFCEVHVPDHSPDHRGFSYLVPDFLADSALPGYVVEVPFKDELVPAVVTKVGVPPPEKGEPKAVASVLLAQPVMAPYQIEAAYALAERYCTHFHATASFFLPNALLKRHLKKGMGYPTAPEGRPNPSPDSPFPQPAVLYDRLGLGAEGIFWTHLPAEPGTALVFPSDAAADRFLSKTPLPKESFLVWRENMPEARDFDFRMKAASGEFPFLIWARKVCSYNLTAYPNLVFFEDAVAFEIRHRFFHSYDLRFLIAQFVRSGLNATFCSYVPSVPSIARAIAAGTLANAP